MDSFDNELIAWRNKVNPDATLDNQLKSWAKELRPYTPPTEYNNPVKPEGGYQPFDTGHRQMLSNDTAIGSFSNAAAAGGAGALGGLASFGAGVTGSDTLQSMADYGDMVSRTHADKNKVELEGLSNLPEYITSTHGLISDVGNLAGSMAAFAPLGSIGMASKVGSLAGKAAMMGARKMLPKAAFKPLLRNGVIKKLGSGVGYSVGVTPAEAMSEGGNVRMDLLENNPNNLNINSQMAKTAALNVPLLALSNTIEGATLTKGLLSMPKRGMDKMLGKYKDKTLAKIGTAPLRIAPNSIASGLQQGTEEALQQGVSLYAKGEPYGIAPWNWTSDQWKDFNATVIPGMLMGVTGGAGDGRRHANNVPMTKEKFFDAVAGQESGGNYNAENARTGAFGKYQIMPSNWPAWAEEAGIGADAPQTPENQEIVTKYKLGQYYDQFGARGALVAWYAGPGTAEQYIANPTSEAWNKKQGNGDEPSINEYVEQSLGRMGDVADFSDVPSAKSEKSDIDNFKAPEIDISDAMSAITEDTIFDDMFNKLIEDQIIVVPTKEDGTMDSNVRETAIKDNNALLLDSINEELDKSDKELAETVARYASENQNLDEYAEITNAINNGDIAKVQAIANQYRAKLKSAAQARTPKAEIQTVDTKFIQQGEAMLSRLNTFGMPEDAQEYLRSAIRGENADLSPQQAMEGMSAMVAELTRRASETMQAGSPSAPVTHRAPIGQNLPATVQSVPAQATTQPQTAQGVPQNNAMPIGLPAPTTTQERARQRLEARQQATQNNGVIQLPAPAVLSDAPAESVAERQTQAQELQQVAQATGVQLPSAMSAGLAKGAKKAILGAQNVLRESGITPESLQKFGETYYGSGMTEGANNNESTESTETTTTQSGNTNNQVQDGQPEKGKKTESKDEVSEPYDSPNFTVGTHTDTRDGKLWSTAKPKDKLSRGDFSTLRKIAKNHNGYYSKYGTVKSFLFNNNADRDAFIEDAEREVFGNKNYAHNGTVEENTSKIKKTTTNSDGIVVVNGDEFGEYTDVKDLRKKAIDYYQNVLQGTKVENAKLGEIDIDNVGFVEFTGSGRREVKGTSAKETKLLLVKHLPTLIQNAENITEEDSKKERHANEHFYYLHTAVEVNGEILPVDITLVKRNNGSIQFYNHVLPTLETEKNEPLVSSAPESSTNEALGTPTVSGSSDSSVPQEQRESNEKIAMSEGILPRVKEDADRKLRQLAENLIIPQEAIKGLKHIWAKYDSGYRTDEERKEAKVYIAGLIADIEQAQKESNEKPAMTSDVLPRIKGIVDRAVEAFKNGGVNKEEAIRRITQSYQNYSGFIKKKADKETAMKYLKVSIAEVENLQKERDAERANANKQTMEDDENNFHGFLDDKKPGAIATIKKALLTRYNPFTGEVSEKGQFPFKHLAELKAKADKPDSHGKRGNRYYIGGMAVPKPVCAYYEYLLEQKGKDSAATNSDKDYEGNELPPIFNADAVDQYSSIIPITRSLPKKEQASSEVTTEENNPAMNVTASYSDKSGGMRGNIKNGVITIWRKDDKKNNLNFTISLNEVDRALENGHGNTAFIIQSLVRGKFNDAVERWIENSPSEKVKNGRRENWENDGGDIKLVDDLGFDSACRVFNELYEKAVGHKPEGKREVFEKLENIARGKKAMQRVINNHEDVENAMYRDDVGSIDFVWGTAGTGAKFKHGFGVAHILAKHGEESGEKIIDSIVETIGKGTETHVQERQGGGSEGARIHIKHKGFTAILTMKTRDKNAWLLTGWEDGIESNRKAPVSAGSEGYDSTTATTDGATPSRPVGETGALSVTQSVADGERKVKENNAQVTGFEGGFAKASKHFKPKQKAEPVAKIDKVMNAFDESELDAEIAKLASEMSKLSANPVFNPSIWKSMFKIGGIYLQKGINTFAEWSKKIVDTLKNSGVKEENITPWVAPVWKSLESYPSRTKFDDELMVDLAQAIGDLHNQGVTRYDDVIKQFNDAYDADSVKELEPVIKAAYNGINEFFTNREEANTDGQQSEGESTAGGRESVQSRTAERAEEGENPAVGVSGEVSGQGSGERTGNVRDNESTTAEESRSAKVRAGSELAEDAGTGDGERGNQQSLPLTEAQKNPKPTETAGHDYEIVELSEGEKENKKKAEVRYKQNIEAIKLLKQLEAENRMPTPSEQRILAEYNGWGSLKNAFKRGTEWNNELRELLTDEEYASVKATMNDAFYTSPAIVRAMWEGVSRLGFKGGRVLDPSMGTGNFYGCMPRGMMKKSSLRGVEIDNITSRIGKMLYPSAYVENTGFEEAQIPDNYYDLVISNVPFGQKTIDKYQIHNYFFANGIDKVRPGGLMVFVTSQGSLVGGEDAVRMRTYLAGKADLIAAYKLPEGTFAEAGTGVITDIVILQKRGEDGARSPYAQNFTEITNYVDASGYEYEIPVNKYFAEHGENILGTKLPGRDQYGNPALIVKAEDKAVEVIGDKLAEAMQALPTGVYHEQNKKKSKVFDPAEANKKAIADEKTRDLEYYTDGGKVLQNQNGEAVELKGKKAEVVRGYIAIKDALNDIIAKQIAPNTTEKELETARKKLNKVYDTFVKKFGYLNNATTARNFKDDPSAGMVQALENFRVEGTGRSKKIVDVQKAAIFSERTMQAEQEVTTVDTPADALLASLSNFGGVDVEYMADLLNKKPADVVKALKGKIFKNPITEEYESREEYLSGNVREKLAQAEEAVKSDKSYQSNVDELKKVIPEDLVSSEIYVNMGAPWIPESDINDFLLTILEHGKLTVKFTPGLSNWSIDGGGFSVDYETAGISFKELLEKILNSKPIEVYDSRGKDRMLNQEKTDAANAVADRIREDFTEWLWSDKEREKRLTAYYNINYNNTVLREYDGSHLNFHGMNAKITLKPHQKNVVWRMLQKGNTLIAHCVGAGKTFEMQAAGMEMRRLGIAKKPLYCLPNNVVEQFAREFRVLYPNAKLLVLQSEDLPSVPKVIKVKKTEDGRTVVDKSALDKMTEKDKERYHEKRAARNRMLARIQTEDWDGIIISHTLFERLPLTPETSAEIIGEQIQDMEDTLYNAKGDKGVDSRALSGLETRIANTKDKLEAILNTSLDEIGIPFEKLGIDQIFVDEADQFKNLGFATSLTNIAGLNPKSDANRSNDMFAKTQWLTRQNGGRGVVFATGTPISNTMAEMFTMLRYLNMSELAAKGMKLFDNWIRTFGEIGTGIERKPQGSGFRQVTKVKRFVNMPELIKMFRSVADVKTQDELNLDIPKLKNGKPTIIALKPDPEIEHYIKEVVPIRVAKMKKGFKQQKGADNMLALTNDLRKLSISDGKIRAVAEQITKKFEETTDVKGAQLVFCDMGIPKPDKEKKSEDSDKLDDDDEMEVENTQVYQKLKEMLIETGIPENQIAFVHDAKTKPQLDTLFQKVNNGDIRILIGSTQKMGAGTNCQKHLVALHDIDAPWRPRDLEQRHGRILRQGNENAEVEIFNYVVQDSFDANMWEKLKNKAAIIAQAMSGNTQLRAIEDADPITLSIAEAEGAATGNPLVKKQLALQIEVTKLANAVTSFKKQQRSAEETIKNKPAEIEEKKKTLAKAEDDIKNRQDTKGDKFKMTVGKNTYTERKEADKALSKVLEKFNKTTSTEIGEIGGMKLKAVYSAKDGVTLQVVGNRAYTVLTNSVLGIENTVRQEPEKLKKSTEQAIADAEETIQHAEETLKKKNPYEEKLRKTKAELDEVTREVQRTLVDDGRPKQQEQVIDPETGEIISTEDEAKYSASEGKEKQRAINDLKQEIAEALPNATNIKDDDERITFTMPNGAVVEINLFDSITVEDDAEARRAHGINGGVAITVNGREYTLSSKAVIDLARNGKEGSVYHEVFHAVWDMTLTDREKAALTKAYSKEAQETGRDLEEVCADKYRDWKKAKAQGKWTSYGKIWQTIQNALDALRRVIAGAEEAHNIFKRIESGEVWNRDLKQGSGKGKENFEITADNSGIRVYNEAKETLNDYQKTVIFNHVRDAISEYIDKMRKQGKSEAEINAELRAENSNARTLAMKSFKAERNWLNAPRLDTEAKRNEVERITGLKNTSNAEVEEIFKDLQNRIERVISYAGRIYREIANERGGVNNQADRVLSWHDAERVRNENLNGKVNTTNSGRSDKDGFSNGKVRYSIDSNDNTSESFITRIKRMFTGSTKQVARDYRQMAKNIIEELAEVKVAWGHMDKGTAAIYKKAQQVIRVAKPYDWVSLMPKFGEAIADRLGISNTEEMQNYIADWILTGNVTNNSAEAEEFQQAMRDNAYMSDKLLELQKIFRDNAEQTVYDFHQDMVSFKAPKKSFSQKVKDFKKEFYDNWIEELGPIARMVDAIEKEKGIKLPDSVNPYVWFRLYRGRYGKAMTMIEGDKQDAVDALQRIYPYVDFRGFKTIQMILDSIGAKGNKKKQEAFSEYVVARHVFDIHTHNNEIREEQDDIRGKIEGTKARLEANEIAERDAKIEIEAYEKQIEKLEDDIMDTPYTLEECKSIIHEGNEKFFMAQRDLVNYSNTMIAILRDAGVITAKQYNNITGKWDNYVPMFREFEENEKVQFGDSLKPQKGSTRKVIDPIQSIIRNTYEFVARAERNKARLSLVNLARCSGVGQLLEEVDNAEPDTKTTIKFYEDGKKKYLVTTPEVAAVVNRIDTRNAMNSVAAYLHIATKIARACFVTINPSYAVRNVFRDVQDAQIYSQYGFMPWDFISGFMHAIHRDEVFYEWMSSGAAQASALSLDRDYTENTVDNLTKTKKEKYFSKQGLLKALQWAGEASEFGTRIAVYERTKKTLNNDDLASGIMTAALESRDTADFARGGNTSRTMNQMVPFFNATVQGWDKFFRAFDPRKPKQFAGAVARLTLYSILPAIMLAYVNGDDDWYKELPDWVKETHWVFKIGDTIFRIPKGQDLGIRMTSNFIETAMSKTDKLTLAKMIKPIKDNLPDLVPISILVPYEAISNYNFFTEAPIVPGSVSNLPDTEQYNNNTSSLARYIGKQIGYSPMKVDHLITGFTGNVGKSILSALDVMAGDKTVNVDYAGLTDAPITNGITFMPYKQSATVTKFYKKYDEMQKENTLFQQTHKARNGFSPSEYKRMQSISKRLTKLAKLERSIAENKEMSAKEKADRQIAIQKKRVELIEKSKVLEDK